jgi:peroxiredoxin
MTVQEGEAFPSFKGQNQNGDTVDLNAYRGDDKMVVFFYPRAGTSG